MADLDKFKGILPYASELLGTYQPIIGWESQSGRRRLGREMSARISAVNHQLLLDRRLSISPDLTPWDLAAPRVPLPDGPSNAIMTTVAQSAHTMRGGSGELNSAQWKGLLTAKTLQGMIQQAVEQLPADLGSADPAVSSGLAGQGVRRNETVGTYIATASLLSYLAGTAPEVLNRLFFSKQADWELALPGIDPLATFSPQGRKAVLAPIGLLHIFRQYFFEFDTFLGPPVGHVWLSPGGTVELIEVNMRKTVMERTTEISLETVTKSEIETSNQDELSDAVKQENAENMKFGASAKGGFNVVVAHAEASASFDLNLTRQTASEQTHKQTRRQSEKLSSEIRRNFKTTFRTVTETTDTSSRRYVVENKTNNLVNYELRRKMRKVGVQLQHIATQMAWQCYVDQPGQYVGTSRLVHIAKTQDADAVPPPPDSPPLPPNQEKVVTITIPFLDDLNQNSYNHRGSTYIEGNLEKGMGESDAKIKFLHVFSFTPPPGMELKTVSWSGPPVKAKPDKDLPDPFIASVEVTNKSKGEVTVTLHKVNFKEQDNIPVPIRLEFAPDDNTIAKIGAEHTARINQYTNAKNRADHEAYIRAVRERVKALGEVKTRAYQDLREEERHIVYRKIIEALVHNSHPDSLMHVTSELVRRLFDVDSMMYFVAPDWWKPRDTSVSPIKYSGDGQVIVSIGTRPQASGDDTVSLGEFVGSKVPVPYLVTEESKPAPLGASLGWVIQLDGDNLRNAFLNASWVKAVLPIRPGREREALVWLQNASVEGAEGLDAIYEVQPGEDPQKYQGKTIRQVLEMIASEIDDLNKQSDKPGSNTSVLPTETVFQFGFDPLQGGVRIDSKPFEVFDQWLEILPTDQVVAVEYKTP